MLRSFSNAFIQRSRPALLRAEFSTAENIAVQKNNRSSEDSEEDNPENLDKFTKEFLSNRIEVTPFQKFLLSAGSSVASIFDPHRHDMIACLGETTGITALENMFDSMKATDEGQRILNDKPRINTKSVDMNYLRSLPDDSFGRTYVKFLDENNVTPDSRMEVRFIEDPQLAYVMTRYRECHDLVHTILGMPTNMLGEVAVKWVEALNTGLPMCYGGAVFGAARLRPKQRKEYTKRYLPWSIQNGKNTKPLIAVYWEERWKQPISQLREELGIVLMK